MEKYLKDFWLERQRYYKEIRQRCLPFGDLVSDRWEKARLLGFGDKTSIYDSALVLGDVKVGQSTWIGPGVILDGAAAPLRIGSYCSISAGAHIYTHDSVRWALTGGRAPFRQGPVTVGDNVYIGPHSVITQGIAIGEKVIVGAQSLVMSSIPPLSAAWGQPARVRGRIKFSEDGCDYDIEYEADEDQDSGGFPGRHGEA
ncbi:MAG: acyltransferase [Candidatus Adiutrix sp.]|jgi:acetyltransferase-like isoleucine patch superfamily enzyme|nr:acyltransferase [Candidatus Adiutrix sp.]